MAELQFPNILGQYQQGFAYGRQVRDANAADEKRSRLADLASKAYGAQGDERQGFIREAVGVDPDAGLTLGTQLRSDDDAREKTLLSTARLLTAAPPEMRPALYQRIRPSVESYLPNLPPEYGPQVEQGIQAFIASRSPGGGEGYTLSPGARRFDAAGKLVAEAPFAPDRPQNAVFQVDRNGVGWWLAPGQPPQRADMPGESMPAPTTGAGGQVLSGALSDASPQGVQALVQGLAGKFGGQTTSLQRSREHNARVGGVANSQHIDGTAGDVVFSDPQAKAQAIAEARAAGLEAIDEGDHVHFELPPGGGRRPAGLNFGKPGGNGPAPPSGYRFTADGRSLEKIPGGPADKPDAGAKPLPVKAVQMDLEIEEALAAGVNAQRTAARHLQRIGSGELDVGKGASALSATRRFFDMGTTQDANLVELKADVTKLVNDSLRLNRGVQTEGDAERARQEVMDADDTVTMVRALKRLVEINKRGIELQQKKRGLLYHNYGRGSAPQSAEPTQSSGEIDSLLEMYR